MLHDAKITYLHEIIITKKHDLMIIIQVQYLCITKIYKIKIVI